MREFTFAPAISLYVNCETEDEVDQLFMKLSKDRQVFMPSGRYLFSEKLACVFDKYGV